MRIVVIDDEVELVRLFTTVLSEEGHEVRGAHDGRAGVQLLEQEAADLVITDLLMPGNDGLEVITAVRQRWPQTRIIAMSGGGRGSPDMYLRMAREFGVQASLTKPVGLDELIATVQQLDQPQES